LGWIELLAKQISESENKHGPELGLAQTNAFFSATFDLLNGDISGPEWLTLFAGFAHCDSAACIWWPAGQPKKFIADFSDPSINLPLDWIHKTDLFLDHHRSQDAAFIDELCQETAEIPDHPDLPFIVAEQLIACIDWFPSRVLLVLVRNKTSGAWTAKDRDLLKQILPTVRKSVLTKKAMSALSDSLDLSEKVFDCFPRGVITMLPDFEVVATNLTAQRFLAEGSSLQLKSGRLVFCDKAIQGELEEQLRVVEAYPVSSIHEYGWYRSISDASGKGALFLTMRGLIHDNWRIESSRHERAVVITLGNKDLSRPPGVAKLQKFYGLSLAQAKVINELMCSGSVEEAAQALNKSVHTVRSHLQAVYEKIGVDSMAQLFLQISKNFTGYGHDDSV
jgi:DNA-binding CsgD family transcriptional regulator